MNIVRLNVSNPLPPTTPTTKDNEISQLSILIASSIKHNLYDEQYRRYVKMIERYLRAYTEIKGIPRELSQFDGTRNQNDR